MIDPELSQSDTSINSTQTNQNNNPFLEEADAEITQSLLPTIGNSIADRFVRSHEIRLISKLPIVSDRLRTVTIITPEGLFQLNLETNTLKCLLNTDELEQLGLTTFVDYSERCTAEEGTLIQDVWTLNSITIKQLCALDRAVIDVGGRSVIGYPIPASIWIKIMGTLFREQYPPKSDDYSRRWLELMYHPIVQDISLSFKVTVFLERLCFNIGRFYFHESIAHDNAINKFFQQNLAWIAIGIASIFSMNMLLLRGNCFFRSTIFSGLNCIRRMEQSMIVLMQIISSEVITWIFSKILQGDGYRFAEYSMVPLSLLAIKIGFDNNDDLYMASALNVFHRPKLYTFLNSLRHALTISSFFSLGLGNAVYYILEDKNNIDDDDSIREKSIDIYTKIQYSVFILALVVFLARYPFFSQPIKNFGRYASNISNAIANSFLISFAMFIVEALIFNLLKSKINGAQAWGKPIFAGLKPLTYLYAFMTTFPTTTNFLNSQRVRH